MQFIRGFIFGSMLQLAVGSVFLYVLNTGISSGLTAALSAAAAVTLIDSVYIAAALSGAASLIHDGNRKNVSYAGAVMLVLFGIFQVISTFISRTSEIMTVSDPLYAFVKVSFLTLSSPMTIVFWAGVFGTKIAAEKYSRSGILVFSSGCVVSTLIAMGLAACAGTYLREFFSYDIIKWLNVCVGFIIIGFGLRMWRKQRRCR